MLFKRLDHVAFRVADVTPVVELYTQKLGYTIVQSMELDFGGSKAKSHVLNLPGQPFYIFIDQGLDADNIITKWVQKNGNRMHHMAYLVDDIHAVAEQMKASGMTFTTDNPVDTGGGLKQLFTRPHPETGLITEIIQRDKEGLFFVQGNVLELIKSTDGLES